MIEFEINGVTRGFKFGTYTFNIINKLAGTKTTDDVFERMRSGSTEFSSIFYYACAQHWASAKKLPIDFTELDVTDWIDELGFEEATRITSELFKVYAVKNLKAPAMGLELQSSNGTH